MIAPALFSKFTSTILLRYEVWPVIIDKHRNETGPHSFQEENLHLRQMNCQAG